MKLIRTHHKSINEGSGIIIFCENKILYDQNEKSYIFYPKDLNLKKINGPYLAIAKINDRYIESKNQHEFHQKTYIINSKSV